MPILPQAISSHAPNLLMKSEMVEIAKKIILSVAIRTDFPETWIWNDLIVDGLVLIFFLKSEF